ncbi:MAG: hypothetical protein EPN46_09955 [Candidimonas sp.]|nr:MAG: hypothetical protein EPN46_09955 [Candidimonas sp.]
MSQLINELAAIDVSNEVLQQFNFGSIYQNFNKNYQKLDDLKKFRSDYEKDNWLARWWHSDKLRDAQLDSAEVQAEFSKAIGQLMMISIVQSKHLAEQQTQLNGQQDKLKAQADGIADHANELQKQHHVLAEQSRNLENLVHEYFALKGLTEEGAQKLIDIANQIKSTKDGMLQAFTERAKAVEMQCDGVTVRMGALSAQVDKQIRQNTEQTKAGIAGLQRETRQVLATSESALRGEHRAAQQLASQNIERLGQNLHDAESGLLAKSALLESNFSSVSENQKANQEALICFQTEVSGRIKRLGYLVAGLSVCVLAGLGGIAHLLNLI